MLRIVFCTDGIYPQTTGGMQKHSRLLIEELSKDNTLSITVLHPHPVAVFCKEEIKEISITPIDENKNYLYECYKYSKRIAFELSKLKSDIIYSQGLSVWANIDRYKHKLIVNPHGLEPYQAIGFRHKLLAIPFRLIFNSIFRKAARVVSLGGELTAIIQKRLSNKGALIVLPNGINVVSDSFDREAPGNPIKVLFLARFAANKGINILFQAIEELYNTNNLSKFQFTLGGKGPLYDQYKTKNKFGNVQLLGFIPDEKIDDLYRTHDVFVLPTLFEGMPTVVLEAMSWKLPVIVTEVGATAELVDEHNGFLIQKASVASLVDSLLKFYALSADSKKLMQISSFEKVRDRFTWTGIAASHKKVFVNLHNETN